MTSPLISILVPVYNVEAYIRRCMDSILAQTFQDYEVIVVDDCGTDQSMAIVEEYAAQDNRIRVLHHEQNMGLMWTRRTGYQVARGEYITFVDSDDELPHNALEVLIGKAEGTNADIIIGNVMEDNGYRKRLRICKLSGNDNQSAHTALLNEEMTHCLWGKLYKHHLFNNDYTTIQHLTICEDGMLFYQLLNHVQHIVSTDDVVYYYRYNKDSSVHKRINKTTIKQHIDFFNFRYTTVQPLYEHKDLLNQRTMRDLCWLYSIGASSKDINYVLSKTSIPFAYNLYNIFHYIPLPLSLKTIIRSVTLHVTNKLTYR